MEINIDENQDTSNSDEMNPVNLVTRIKQEVEEPQTSLKEYSEMSDFVSCFRRRRRGRGRYVPYMSSSTFEQTRAPFNCSTNGIENSKKLESLYPSTSMNCKHFSCPNCKIQFPNRDSLAMHMMESVRLEGCQTQKTSKEKNNNSSAGSLDSASASRAPFTTHYENGCRDNKLSSNTNNSNNNSNYRDLPHERLQPTCFLCKVCGEAFVNLDSLAMHMFVHVQQETSSKESLSPAKSNHSLMPLPETIWSNQLNSSLYFKSFLATSMPDRLKSQHNNSSTSDSFDSQKLRSNKKCDSIQASENVLESIERNCKSAPIINAASDSKTFTKLGAEPMKLPAINSTYDCHASISPNNVKDSFDSSEIQFLSKLHRCNHCRIHFEDLTTFCLHMGLHNVNNPWQCNMCGKKCVDLHDFTVHSLHF